MARRAFGELEDQILFLLKSGERKTVKEIHQSLDSVVNYNTVMTVMTRLVQKNQLAREKKGLQYEYWILKEATIHSVFQKLKQKLLGTKTSALVSFLIESSADLTEEDLLEMEQMIQQKRSQT